MDSDSSTFVGDIGIGHVSGKLILTVVTVLVLILSVVAGLSLGCASATKM